MKLPRDVSSARLQELRAKSNYFQPRSEFATQSAT